MLVLFWNLYERQTIKIQVYCQKENLTIEMSIKDKKRLEALFYDLFFRDTGAYTLFGQKPMFMSTYTTPLVSDGSEPFIPNGWKDFVCSIFACNLKQYIGWKTWQKYQSQFPISKFVFLKEKNPFRAEPHSCYSILLIYKQKLQETIDSNLKDFQTVLRKDPISAEELLQEAKSKPFFQDILKLHDGLIGTIFGFGRNNAWFFEAQKQGKQTPLAYVWEEEKYGYEPFSWRDWAWMLLGFYSLDIEKSLGYPGFMADLNSQETKKIKEDLLNTRREIIKCYKNKDLVETTLNLLINGPPEKYSTMMN
jgi:hypothetical protein